MALISCPECGKQISDKVNACPHCGYPMSVESQDPPSPQQVEVVSVKIEPKNRKRILIGGVVAVAFVVIVIAVALVAKQQNESAARAAYIKNLTEVRTLMLTGGADAEGFCNLVKSVWYNTIYEQSDSKTDKYTKTNGKFRDDFNDSLSALFLDKETIRTSALIEGNQEKVAAIMLKLQNPPSDLVYCYNTVELLYDAYCDLTNLALSPSGSLKTFSENFNNYDNDFMKYYDKLGTQIPKE